MKKTNTFKKAISIFCLIATFSSLFAKSLQNQSKAQNFSTFTKFTGEKVSKSDLEKIVSAGVNVPNEEINWHFSVITNEKTLAKIDESIKNSIKPNENENEIPVPKDPTLKTFQKGENYKTKENEKSDKRNFNRNFQDKSRANFEKTKQIAQNGINNAPLAIALSTDFSLQSGSMYALQCMVKKAQELGLYVQIVNPFLLPLLNEEEMKTALQTPEDFLVKTILLIGKAEFSETEESTKERTKPKEAVTYVN